MTRKALLFVCLAGLVILGHADDKKAKQIPIDIDNFVPLTFGEVMEKIEEQAPIEDIIGMCRELRSQIQADLTAAQEELDTFVTTHCNYEEKEQFIRDNKLIIGGAHVLINASTEEIKRLRDEEIPALQLAVAGLRDDIQTEVAALEQTAHERLDAYKLYLAQQDLYRIALKVLDEIVQFIQTSALDSYALEGKGSQDSAAAALKAGNAPAPAPAPADTSAEAPAFLAIKAKILTSLRSQAKATTGIQQELLMRSAMTVHKAAAMDAIYEELYNLRNDIQDNLESLRQDEWAAYELFVQNHLAARKRINDLQDEIEVNRVSIADKLLAIATEAAKIAGESKKITEAQALITETEAHLNKLRHSCEDMQETTTTENKRRTSEIATLDELIQRLQSFTLSDYQQSIVNNGTADAPVQENPTEAQPTEANPTRADTAGQEETVDCAYSAPCSPENEAACCAGYVKEQDCFDSTVNDQCALVERCCA